MEKQPAVNRSRKKQAVRKGGVLPSQRTKETIADPQRAAGQKTIKKAQQGN